MTARPESARFRNHLLACLPAEEQNRLAALLEPVELKAREVIEPASRPIEHVYFPESGIASVVAIDRSERRMEAGPFGRDGMSGTALLLDTDRSPHETLVQVSGAAHRMTAKDFQQHLREAPTVHRHLLRYVQAFAVQTAHTALAAGLAVVEKRLARWILMLHDRIDGDELSLTHEFMALMLAVRRPGVTVALHELEGRHLIRSIRGKVIVRDREGLVAFCDGFYGVPEAEYTRLIGCDPTA